MLVPSRGSSIADFKEYLSARRRTVYTAYKYRFVVATVFTLGCITNAIQWWEFVPLLTSVKQIFGVSSANVSFCLIIISQILYTPACFVSNFVIDKLGFRFAIIIGTFLTTLGAFVRCFCGMNYYFLLLGSVFSSFAMPFFAANCQKVSVIWFPTEERALCTTLILGIYNLGNAIGSQLPVLVGNTTELSGIIDMLYVSTGICAAVFVLTLVFFMEQPPSPPSKGAEAKKYDFKESLLLSVMNPNLMILMASVCIFQGVVQGIQSDIDFLFEPLGIKSNQISNVVTISTFLGIFQSLIVGFLLTKYQKYKTFCLIARGITTLCYVGLIYTSYMSETFYIEILLILFMSLGNCANPATFEMICEISFPIAEDVTGSLFTLGYGLLGGGFGLLIDAIIGDGDDLNKIYLALFIFLAVAFIGLIMSFFVREQYKRTVYEKEGARGLKNLQVANIGGLDLDFSYIKL